MTQAASLPGPPLAVRGEGGRIALAGALDIRTLADARKAFARREASAVDLAGLERLDTPGALFLRGLRARGVALDGIREEHAALLDLVEGLDLRPLPAPKRVPRGREIVMRLGRAVEDVARDLVALVAFIGQGFEAIMASFVRPRELSLAAISRQVAETGVNALPIVGTLAFMVAVVIGYQGVAQLRPYGGADYTVNLVAVSVLREMAVLITAIVVAGRSGAAFTAEIGAMKAREEIDALRVMGFEPFRMLVVPRLIGLVVTLPLLAFFADLAGLLGGAVISMPLLDLSPPQYFERVRAAVTTGDFVVGLIKAPVFGFVIAAIGCMHGLKVRGSAESVGRETTRAVVKGIFAVIVLDALFSVFFERIGV